MDMPSKTLCDGSVVQWAPKWEDTTCDECGHVTGQVDRAEPEFHGKTVKKGNDWFCSRCGDEFVGLAKAGLIAQERIIPAITKLMEQQSPFYRFLAR